MTFLRPNMNWQDTDPYAALVGMVDDAFMRLYAHARRNSRRIARLVVTLLPLVMLLVSSCKNVSVDGSYSKSSAAEQLRAALFPSVTAEAPARGYIAMARDYISGAPQNLQLLTSKEIAYLFGKPALSRREADAEVWQYRAKTCVVDFYFYGGKPAADVSYIDVRLKNSPVVASLPEKAQRKCIDRVIAEGGFAGSAI